MVSDHDLLVRIDEKVDNILARLDDHEARIRPLETQQHKWLGRDGAIAFAISAAVSALVAILAALAGGQP